MSGESQSEVSEARIASYPTPEEVVASVLADGRTAGADGLPRVGRATRKKAHEVTRALREQGRRILR